MARQGMTAWQIAGKVLAVIAILVVVAGIIAVAVAGIWSLATDLSFVEVWQTWFNCLPAEETAEVIDKGEEVVATFLR